MCVEGRVIAAEDGSNRAVGGRVLARVWVWVWVALAASSRAPAVARALESLNLASLCRWCLPAICYALLAILFAESLRQNARVATSPLDGAAGGGGAPPDRSRRSKWKDSVQRGQNVHAPPWSMQPLQRTCMLAANMHQEIS